MLVLVLLWQVAALTAESRFFPTPVSVAGHVVDLTLHGHLVQDFAKTVVRALAGFVVAMVFGGALGFLLGRVRMADQLFGPWVVVGLNMPAVVIAVICYIWLGLSEFALVLAVVINKTPLVVTTIREGVRSFLPDYDELATVFRMPPLRRLRLGLARALSVNPRLLLLDEPFVSLDRTMVRDLQNLFLSLFDSGRPTVILVSHDPEDAARLADRVGQA